MSGAVTQAVSLSVVDEARSLIVTTLRDDARKYAPVASGKGAYEYLADMATKVERAEAVQIPSYLVIDCVIQAFAKAIADERERCAGIADAYAGPGALIGDDVTRFVNGIATAIRASGGEGGR